jgi:hypothetical protein
MELELPAQKHVVAATNSPPTTKTRSSTRTTTALTTPTSVVRDLCFDVRFSQLRLLYDGASRTQAPFGGQTKTQASHKSVRKAKKISASTPALQERHGRSFWGILPVLKAIWHSGEIPLKSAGTARRHMSFSIPPAPCKNKEKFSTGASYSGLNTQHISYTRARQEKQAQAGAHAPNPIWLCAASLGCSLLRNRDSAGTRNFRNSDAPAILTGMSGISGIPVPRRATAPVMPSQGMVHGRYWYLNSTGLADGWWPGGHFDRPETK